MMTIILIYFAIAGCETFVDECVLVLSDVGALFPLSSNFFYFHL